MATREYRFIVGPETDELPTAGTPTAEADLVTKGYADAAYTGTGAANVTAFNATTDWGAAAGGYYSLTVPVATHGKGTSPRVQEWIADGADFKRVQAEEAIVNAAGDVTLKVPESPDGRFAGKLVIS